MSEKIVQLNEAVIKSELKELVRGSVEETLTYCDFPGEHWTRICTNNVIERLNREIRRTRVVGRFPDGNSALMLVCARLRHSVGQQEVHEHEASGGCSPGCLHCWLTSFTSDPANQFAKIS